MKTCKWRNIFIGCFFFMLANFVAQWMQPEPDLPEAFQRSYSQLMIVLYVWYMTRKTITF